MNDYEEPRIEIQFDLKALDDVDDFIKDEKNKAKYGIIFTVTVTKPQNNYRYMRRENFEVFDWKIRIIMILYRFN